MIQSGQLILMSLQLLKCKGYRCAVTRLWDSRHIAVGAPSQVLNAEHEGCHIMKRAVASYVRSDVSDIFWLLVLLSVFKHFLISRRDAAATWDTIRNYADFAGDIMDKIIGLIDDHENGVALNIVAHQSFDKFKWCLVEQVRHIICRCLSVHTNC